MAQSQIVILDANILIELLRDRSEATLWLASLPVRPALSGIAFLEVLYGAQNTADLRKIERSLRHFTVEWPYPTDAIKARELASLRLSHGFGAFDALVAASALRLGEPLATFNVKHFRAIPGLLLVQPYERT